MFCFLKEVKEKQIQKVFAQLHWDSGAVTCHLERRLHPRELLWSSARGKSEYPDAVKQQNDCLGAGRVTCMTRTPVSRVFGNSAFERTLFHCPSATQLWATVFALGPKATVSSFSLLAPNHKWIILYYQLSGNLLSTHTQTQKGLPFLSLLRSL